MALSCVLTPLGIHSPPRVFFSSSSSSSASSCAQLWQQLPFPLFLRTTLSLRHRKCQPWPSLRCSASSDYTSQLANPDSSGEANTGEMQQDAEPQTFWRKLQTNPAELKARIAKLGLAAVLAYGLFDGITYTTFFVLAFLGYEKSTGNNPAANLQALLGIVILMWTGNNVTRPFRVAGAAAIAPFVDKALKKLQQTLKLPNQFSAFILVVISFASLCMSIAGLLILSRLGK